MWEATPLPELGSWDDNCFYKIKDGSRRCKFRIGGDAGEGRFGNKNKLMAKISRGVSLTGQEKNELARGLCCLKWHSTEYIAREICEMWATQPTTVLVPPPSQQSEVQRLKAENGVLIPGVQRVKAMEKQYHDNRVGTFPQIESLKAEIQELKKTLEETRQVNEVLEDENEFLTTKFGFPRKRALSKATFCVPAVTAVSCSNPKPLEIVQHAVQETSMPVTPVKRTVSFNFDTPADPKMPCSHSFEDSGVFSSASTPDPTSSAKKAYSASPTCRPRVSSSSSSESLILFEDDYEALDLAATNLSSITPFFPAIDDSDEVNVEVKQEPHLGTVIWSATPEAAHIPAPSVAAVEQPTTEATEPEPQPLEISPQPVGTQLERLLVNLFCTVIFPCWAGSLSCMQFTGFVVWTCFVVWTQVGCGGMTEMVQKYCAVEDVSDEDEVHGQSQLVVVMRLTAPDVDEEVVEEAVDDKGNGVEEVRALMPSAEIMEANLAPHRHDQQLELFQSTGSDVEWRVVPRGRVAKKSRTTVCVKLPQDFTFTFTASPPSPVLFSY